MSRDFGPMDSTTVRLGVARVVAIYLAMAGFAAFTEAQDQAIRTIATKSDLVEKSSVDEKHPLFPLLQISYKSLALLETVDDYECVFVKQELIGKKLIKSKMALKFRESPQSVYLKFLDANAGREVIFVQGQNNNSLLVHEAGIKSVLGTMTLAPNSPDVMAENRYPITSIGLKNMLASVIKQWESEGKFGGITTKKYEKSKSPSGDFCTVYEAVHSQPFKEFKFHTTRLWVDDATGLAIGVQQYAFPGKNDKEPQLAEEYFYLKIKTNLKFSDNEFSKSNSNYTFK